jgi:hypothetical protein
VIKAAGGNASLNPMELCERVVGELHLPKTALNPLVAKSLAANLKALSQKELPRG